jgi:hypothetical protein
MDGESTIIVWDNLLNNFGKINVILKNPLNNLNSFSNSLLQNDF